LNTAAALQFESFSTQHDEQFLHLPCGGLVTTATDVAVTSVYRSAGPILNNLTIALWQPVVYAGQSVDIIATAFYIASSITPLGSLLFY